MCLINNEKLLCKLVASQLRINISLQVLRDVKKNKYMEKQFTDQNFQKEVIEASSSKPVLVDFFASWCGPCKMMAPIIEEVAKELSESASVGKLDTEANNETSAKYEIMSIPTILLFKDGEIKETLVGLQSKEALVEVIKKYS